MLGESAGRSRNNPTSSRARRRATYRERTAVEPPKDQLVSIKPKRWLSRHVFVVLLLGIIWAGGVATTFITKEARWIVIGQQPLILVLYLNYMWKTK